MNMIAAVGGPLDGGTWPCRYPDGLVLVNKLTGGALVYDRHADRLIARELDVLDRDAAVKAAESDTYDVLAYDPETMGEWKR
jgi:hypothetical protein